MANGFAEFASGFAGSLERGIERRRLRDTLALEQKNKDRNFNLRQQEFGLSQERLGWQQKVQEKQEQIETKRLEMQKRQADIQAIGMFGKLKEIPKAARPLFLKQLAPKIGIDPESKDFQDVVKMIGQLSPEELQATTDQFLAIFPSMEPGQASAFARGVISGQITLNDALTQVGELRTIQARQGGGGGTSTKKPKAGQVDSQTAFNPAPAADQLTPLGGEQKNKAAIRFGEQPGEDAPTSPQELRQQALELTQEAQRLTKLGDEAGATRYEAQARNLVQIADDMDSGREFDPQEVEKRAVAEETGKERARRKKTLRPDIADTLGIKTPGRLTIGEAEDYGIYPELIEPKEAIKVRKGKHNAQELIRKIDDVDSMLIGPDGQPRDELIGFVGSSIRTLESLVSQVEAVSRLSTYVQGGQISRFSNSKEVKKVLDETGLVGASATLKSRVIDLAFTIARAREEGRLSNQDVEQAMRELAASSGSANQMVAVLGDLRERVRQGTMSDIEAATGMKPLDMLTGDELVGLAADSEPEWVLRAILAEQQRRLKRTNRSGR